MNTDHWTIIKDLATLALACGAALIAALGYFKNAKTKRAEFLRDLHKSFFEDAKYDKVREELDNGSSVEALQLRSAFIRAESEGSTRFLNFFQLVAYFQKCGVLSMDDIEALLGYYLKLLCTDDIRDYLRQQNYLELDRLHGIIR